jgi:hypothetical protein
MMANYDDGEYYTATMVRTEAELGINKCDDPEAMRVVLANLSREALALQNYTQHIPDNEDAFELATNLNKLVASTSKIYGEKDPSAGYCKAKMNLIVKGSEKVQKVLGSKPR